MRTQVSPTYVVWYKKSGMQFHSIEIDAVKWSTDVVETRHIEVFATFEMGYSFIQSVLIRALKQLWDSNHDSSVAMTQLYMCAKDHFDWLNNFGNMRPNPKGNLFLLTVYIGIYIVSIFVYFYFIFRVYFSSCLSFQTTFSGNRKRKTLNSKADVKWHTNVQYSNISIIIRIVY